MLIGLYFFLMFVSEILLYLIFLMSILSLVWYGWIIMFVFPKLVLVVTKIKLFMLNIFFILKSEFLVESVSYLGGNKIAKRYLTGSFKFRSRFDKSKCFKFFEKKSNVMKDNIDLEKTLCQHPNVVLINPFGDKLALVNLTHSRKFNGKYLIQISNSKSHINKTIIVKLGNKKDSIFMREQIQSNFVKNNSISFSIETDATVKVNKLTGENFMLPGKEETVQEFLKNLK